MVIVNGDVSFGGSVARQDRTTVTSPHTPPSAQKLTVEAPAQAITGISEALTASNRENRRNFDSHSPKKVSEESSTEKPGKSDDGDGGKVFQRQFDKTISFDPELQHTFTDIKLASNEEVSIRIPTENFVKRLNETVETLNEHKKEGQREGDDGVNVDV
jgi:hypothetical protein